MHHPNKNLATIIPTGRVEHILLLVLLGGIMFFIRTVTIYHRIFTDWPGDYGNFVNFSADDAVYHMRLVHNTIRHFPWRIFFDPFTHFPFGNQVHFGPLFTLIIAVVALIAGLGHPTPELINIVGAYLPVVMGVLCLIPVYFIGRGLGGKAAAILPPFVLTFLAGEFLQRSALGFTDHHVAEVLFSTTTCALLIYALNAAKNQRFTFNQLFWQHHRLTLIYGLLAGVALGLFILVWPAALMFGVVFLIFFITQLLIDHNNSLNTEYLLLLATLIYGVPALMVLPYACMNPHLDLMYYSLVQPLVLTGMAVIFAICYLVHLGFKRNRLIKNFYSLGLIAFFVVIFFLLYRYVPKFYTLMQDGCKLLFEPTPGMRTVSEVRPGILDQNGNFTVMRFWHSYFWAAPLTVIGLGYLGGLTYKQPRPAEVLLLIWTIVIILATCAQCRFNYYLAINVAIVAGCYGFYPFLAIVTSLNPQKNRQRLLQQIVIYVYFCLFSFLMADHSIMFLLNKQIPSGIQISHESYDAYMWLKRHTPDPQGKTVAKNFDYTAGYYPIPQDPTASYSYPKSAYGIMAWWDIGHQLIYIAERIPNTNPFQLGVVEHHNTAGAALFFTSRNEEQAVKNLNTVGSRYVFIDHNMATSIAGMGVWCNDTDNWETPFKAKIILADKKMNLDVPVDAKKFSQSMLNRIYYNDTNGLRHFRLVYESDGDYLMDIKRAIFKPKFRINGMTLRFKKYEVAVKDGVAINRIFWANKEKTVLAYHARPPVKSIKIFEKVAGAVINGVVPKTVADNTKINLTLKLTTKFNRIFTYEQTTRAKNGKYKFIVPYPTTAMRGSDYSYDIQPLGEYLISVGSKKIKVFVPEQAVMLGEKIDVCNSA